MATQCSAHKQAFHDLGSRAVAGRFDGGEITSDAGGLLLREADRGIGLLGRMSECFLDHRSPERIEHSLESFGQTAGDGVVFGV